MERGIPDGGDAVRAGVDKALVASHSFWKGYLKLSLVTCPVALIPAATESEKIRFHTLNRKTGARVVSRYVDEETGRPVDDDDEAKGYERGEGDFLVLDDDELESVRLESVRTIDIESFARADSVDWLWFDSPFYLVPDDPVGEEAYCVIRDAMQSTGTIGISRLVLYRRERAVLLKPFGKGVLLWTLRYGEEVRDPGKAFGPGQEADIDPELLGLVRKLVEERKTSWSPAMARDPVQERLSEIINEKKKGRSSRPKPAAPAEAPSNVVNIQDALRRSVISESKGKPKPPPEPRPRR